MSVGESNTSDNAEHTTHDVPRRLTCMDLHVACLPQAITHPKLFAYRRLQAEQGTFAQQAWDWAAAVGRPETLNLKPLNRLHMAHLVDVLFQAGEIVA